MKALLQVLKNYSKKHCISILLALLFLSVGGTANALMIKIENISDYQQEGISLGFSLDGSTTRDHSEYFVYNLNFGDIFTTPDIPEISGSGVSLFSYGLYPSSISQSSLAIPVAPSASFEVGSNVGLDRVRFTFLETTVTVIPEPASLLLFGSGLLGLLVLRRR